MNMKMFEKFQYENQEFSIQQIREEYEKNESILIKQLPVDKVAEVAWGVTKRNLLKQIGAVVGEYQGASSGDVVELEGVLIGVGTFRDRAQEMRTRAEKAMNDPYGGKGEAMAANLIDKDGRPLDTRAKLFGRVNEGYGKPLDPDLKLLEMGLYGAFREKGTDDPFMYTRFQTSNNALAEAWGKVDVNEHLYKPYETYGKIKTDEYGWMIYGLTGSGSRTVFKSCDDTFNVEKAVNEALGQYMWPINSAYEGYKSYLPKIKGTQTPDLTTKKIPWNSIVAVKGLITDIQKDRTDFWKGIPAKMWDLDDVAATVDVYLPAQYKDATWGEYTTGIAFGKPDEVWLKDEAGKYNTRSGRMEVRAYGFFPIPSLMVGASQGTLEESPMEYVGFES